MSSFGDRIGIEFITGHGMDPAEFVHLAADLDVGQVGLALAPILLVPEDAPRWSLREDKALYAAVQSALAARGVRVMLAEGFMIHPAMDIAHAAADLDLFAGLGAGLANCLSMEPDTARAHDQFAQFAEMTAARGMAASLEFLPGLAIDSFDKALACARAATVGKAGALVDAMHFFRTGGTIEALKAADPALIGHIQLCDVPLVSTAESYGLEAKCDRLAPGEGELPLRAFLEALPRDLPIGLEVPQQSKGLAGVSHRERIGAVVAAARKVSTGLL